MALEQAPAATLGGKIPADADGWPRQFTYRLANRARAAGHVLPFLAILVLTGSIVLGWPLLFNFNKFAFWDWGGHLAIHCLRQQGYLPVTDFGWHYGLLPLFLQELWLRLVAPGPVGLWLLCIPFALILTVTIGEFAARESKSAGRALVLLCLPFIVAFGIDLPHMLEPALLSMGLLFQAKGKREYGLAFATGACFSKPVMGYFYALLLLVCIAADLHRRGNLGVASFARALIPAACTWLGLVLVLGIAFGPTALLGTLLPLTGARAYRLLHFGWSGSGTNLFYFPGLRLAYYIGTPVTFWVCATICLVAAVGVAGWRIVRHRLAPPENYEVVLTCALLHVAFLTLFYGPAASWTYYAYILVMGVAATDGWSRVTGRAVWGLCILAALGNYSSFKASLTAWKTMRQSAVTAGLFAPPAESAEWGHVASIVQGKHPALLTWDGGAEALFAWMPRPVGAFMMPGVVADSEIERKLGQLRSADALILPELPEYGYPITEWPGLDLRTLLDNKKLVFKGKYFEVYEGAPAGVPGRRD